MAGLWYEIQDDRQLRQTYESMMFLQKLYRENDSEERNRFCGALTDIKRSIRRYLRETDPENCGWRIVKDNGIDGYVELIELGDGFKDRDEAERHFVENYYREYRPSAYDCTGQLFTGWYKVFRRGGRWMAYHDVERDV